MKGLLKRLLTFFLPETGTDPAASKADVHKRYRHFRTLLTANNNALELMADMEQALQNSQPYGMSFVRGHCTALSVNVYKMVLSLMELSSNRYGTLKDSFTSITDKLEKVLEPQESHAHGPSIIQMSEADRTLADQAGDKMSNLGEVANRIGLKTPEGFVITASAGRRFMLCGGLQDEINRRLKSLDMKDIESLFDVSQSIQQAIADAPLPPELEAEIMAAYADMTSRLGKAEVLVAMRSSALGEDGGRASFAGQYRTHLNVSREHVSRAYKEIIASKYKAEAIVYRNQRGYRHQDAHMCVGCLAMVDAAVSGVSYSRSPSDARGQWVEISATEGLAEAVVSGRAKEQTYRVARTSPFHACVESEGQALLNSYQLSEIARAAVLIEDHFGVPQDIEWSIDKSGELFILQARPIPPAVSNTPDSPGDEGADDSAFIKGGHAASRGAASGPAFIVRSGIDMLQFEQGSVLVVEAPLPEFAALAPRAVAIVSETGGSAAHLATVAREFGLPALFGLSGATQIIKQGQLITVDAAGRRIYDGRNEGVLSTEAARPSLMRGSPVEAILTEALKLISPLNLTDPGSPFFRPSSCQTLHDVTRFCHEKAVVEMFSAGSVRRREHAHAKQLVDESAYHWWVLNLDDGFRPEFDMKEYFVRIDDIVSVPMHALWAGMTAVPWQGPPPVDLKGFGSILFRSTMNPHLDPAVRSNLADKNYFLVSKYFCNLSVRLGYHFALAEAHVGDMLTENYVSFTFKGGAADRHRRGLRVHLLKEILGAYGFRCEQKMDALSARVEKRPSDYLLTRLKILGYLVIHTRQIDMVMEDMDAVERYREKLTTGIDALLANSEGTDVRVA